MEIMRDVEADGRASAWLAVTPAGRRANGGDVKGHLVEALRRQWEIRQMLPFNPKEHPYEREAERAWEALLVDTAARDAWVDARLKEIVDALAPPPPPKPPHTDAFDAIERAATIGKYSLPIHPFALAPRGSHSTRSTSQGWFVVKRIVLLDMVERAPCAHCGEGGGELPGGLLCTVFVGAEQIADRVTVRELARLDFAATAGPGIQVSVEVTNQTQKSLDVVGSIVGEYVRSAGDLRGPDFTSDNPYLRDGRGLIG
jgi:hypothetical protein